MRSPSPAERCALRSRGAHGRAALQEGAAGPGRAARPGRPAEPWHRRAGGERGGVTAEFAVALPAVLLVLAASLGGVQVASQSLRLQDAASGAARALARGDAAGAIESRAAMLVPGIRLTPATRGDLACVTASVPATGPFAALTLTASGCALAGGE